MLKDTVPIFVAQMSEMAELFHAEQPELDRIKKDLEDIVKQFYAKTATYSLKRWEEDFGLQPHPSLSEEQRRARVIAKMNTRTPATVKMLENLVLQTLDADAVFIREYPSDYSFAIYVEREYLIELGAAEEAVYYARPAHLDYRFIQVLVRNARMAEYVGAYGISFPSKHGCTDVEGLYKKEFIGIAGVRLEIKEGTVHELYTDGKRG